MTTYNPKQKDFLKRVQNNTLSRINILEGSVSSGKTWISLVAWAFWVATMPKQGLYMMCAKTLTTLKNNCLRMKRALKQQFKPKTMFIASLPVRQTGSM